MILYKRTADPRTEQEKAIWQCKDCKIDTYQGDKNYYMVRKDIWEAHGADKGMLCIDCLEQRLGRPLKGVDFTNAPINYMNSYVVAKMTGELLP